jgi:hypothetical protein
MTKRLSIILGVIAAVVLGGAVAFAQTSPGEGSTLRGAGFLKASGSGTISIEMSGRLRMAADGNVTIVDRAGDARVHIGSPGTRTDGAEELTGESSYELTGFEGVVHVAGSDLTVEVEGFAAFAARGEGTASLIGDGVWKTRYRWGFWSESGEALNLAG